MSGKNEESSVKVFLHVADFFNQLKDSEGVWKEDETCIKIVSDKEVDLLSEKNNVYKKYNFNGKIFSQANPISEIVSDTVEPMRQKVTIEKNNMTYVTFGDNSYGK